MKFYTDVHIAREVIRQLQNKGVEIIHCSDVGMAEADDPDHLHYAAKNGYILVTCDEDFERYHAQWQKESREHGGIVYFRMKDQCKSIGLVVKEILFLHEAAEYPEDLYNQIWRAQG